MKKTENIAVKLENVTKTYSIHHEKPTLMERLINNKEEQFTALENLNLEIHRGEKVGLIGSNGSGKTTLLKIIAGITSPSKGKVKTNGRIVSLIDLEAGFHPELSGIQNIFINGMILGMTKKQILKELDSIIQFADLGRFIESQLYTYSDGMILRLGFAIAIHSNPDIIMIDENLAVGDENFKKKAHSKIMEMIKSKKTLILVSHVMEIIRDNCDRVVWLNKGKIKKSGGKEIIKTYLRKSI